MTRMTCQCRAAWHLATASLARALRQRPDSGQASTEYAGILFVIVALVAALIAAGFTDVGEAIKMKIVQAVNKIG
ncbi:MAG: hypothetical protein ACRC35_12165 [Angustibacter sp.]